MNTACVKVKGFDGEMKDTKLLGIFAEKDAQDRIFYKIEAQNYYGVAAVCFIYDQEKAIAKFNELMRDVLTEQTKILEGK